MTAVGHLFGDAFFAAIPWALTEAVSLDGAGARKVWEGNGDG